MANTCIHGIDFHNPCAECFVDWERDQRLADLDHARRLLDEQAPVQLDLFDNL